MTENPGGLEEKLDKAIDKILASEDVRRAALKSKNPLLQSAARLSSDSARPQLSVAAKSATLQQVLDSMPQPTADAPKLKTSEGILRPSFWITVAKAAAGFVVFILLAGLVAVPASADSLPGEVLYQVKRGFEDVQLTVAQSPVAEVEIHLAHAQSRMVELQRLVQRGNYEETLLVDSLNSLSDAITIAVANDLYEGNATLVAETDTTFASIATTMNQVEGMDIFDGAIVDWEEAYNAIGQQYNAVGDSNIPGDFGCGRPGNACNAPGHSNGNGNGNAIGNADGNGNGNANGRGNGNGNSNGNANGNGRGR